MMLVNLKKSIIILSFLLLISNTITYSKATSTKPTKDNIYSICDIDQKKFVLHLFKNFNQNKTEKCLAIFADRDINSYGRFRAPKTIVFILKNKNSNWLFEYENKNFSEYIFGNETEWIGRFGQLYEAKLLKIGNDHFGLAFVRSIYSTIIPYHQNKFKEADIIYTSLGSDEDSFKASFEFIKKSSKGFYDIRIESKGNVDQEWLQGIKEQTVGNVIMSSRKVQDYSFNNGYYLPVQSALVIGEKFRLGNFEYRVNKIEFKKEIRNVFTSKKADGIYLLVSLTMINKTREPRTITSSMFQVFDSEGYQFDASQDAITILVLNDSDRFFMLKEIPPKIPKEIIMPFEVPTSRETYSIKVSGGFGSSQSAIVKLKK